MAKTFRCLSLISSVALAGSAFFLAPNALAACPQPDPGTIPYVPAKAPSTACSAADLLAFENAAVPGATYEQVETAMTAQNSACSACIFSHENDATYGPIVYVGNQGAAYTNWSACLEKAPGGSSTCGAAYSRFGTCLDARCAKGAGLCADDTAVDTCYDTVATDTASCGKYDPDSACPNFDALANGPCADLITMISTLCAGGVAVPEADAGPGGGTTDAGVTADAGVGPGGGKDAGPSKPTKKDAGTSKTDAGKDDGDDGDDSSGGLTSGSDAGSKKKDAGNSAAADDDSGDDSAASGCAQAGGSGGGSLASAFLLMFAVGGAIRNRRKR